MTSVKTKVILVAALAVLALPSFAKETKLKNPGKREVILIGRVSVKPDEDMSFYGKTRGVPESDWEKPGLFGIPFAPADPDDFADDYKDFVKDNERQVFSDGEFFYAIYRVNKKTRSLIFDVLAKYRFFGSNRAFIWLPFDFTIDVPEGVSAMYLGSFYFHTTGNNFTIDKIAHADEYELAQEALDKVTKKHFDLYRADIKSSE